MGLLNQNNKKGDKKSGNKASKGAPAASKFIPKGNKPSGGPVMKKTMTGGSQRGS